MSAYYELTDEQLLALPTNRLYNIYKIYRSGNMTVSGYGNEDLSAHQLRLRAKCDFIKAELDKRGHIPRKHNPTGANVETPFQMRSYWSTADYKPAKEPVGSIENPEDAIGKQVYKKSKKPFKSKNVYNTVESVTTNPHTDRVAFAFEEDSSIVDVHLRHLRKVK